VAGALLDIWHADGDGRYHDADEDYRLRGQLLTDADGAYALETVRPGHYLNGPGYRPAHIHFMVTKPGLAPLTTQLYFAGDPYLAPVDSCGFCASGDATLIIELSEKAGDPGAREGTFDIVLAPA
jgi:catechol 1,2-dioxygenase